MNVRFAPSLRTAAVLLVLVSPAFGQERAPAKGIPSLADFDDSIEALVRTVDPSIVQVFTSGLAPLSGVVTDQSNLVTPQRSSGSGVIVDAEGYIVTNAHVVRGASRIRVEIPTVRTPSSQRSSISVSSSIRCPATPEARATSTRRFEFDEFFEPSTRSRSISASISLTAHWRFEVA